MSLINKIKEQQKPAPIISLIIFSFILFLNNDLKVFNAFGRGIILTLNYYHPELNLT